MIQLTSVFALELFAEGKIPCFVTQFDYYDRVTATMVAPIVISVVLVLVGILLEARERRRRRRGNDNRTRSMLRSAKRRGSEKSVIKAGLWRTAAINLFVIDLMFPTITRTLLAFFSCRGLNTPIESEEGRWLEADHSIECNTPKYNARLPLVAAMSASFVFGVPALFYYLESHFATLGRGKARDKVVEGALGWMCTLRDQARVYGRLIDLTCFSSSCVLLYAMSR